MSQLRFSNDTLPARLDEVEIRVLGSLMEKAVLTPRHYPLTMAGLCNACNQKAGRNPAVAWHEHVLHGALARLTTRGLVRDASTSRARKVEHCADSALGLDPAGIAVLCVLMLRGPQTCEEILAYTAPLHPFDGLPAVEHTLRALIHHEPEPLAAALEQGADGALQRFRQCLEASDEPAAEPVFTSPGTTAPPPPDEPAETADQAAEPGVDAGDRQREIRLMREELLKIRQLLDEDAG